jgi:IS30 family transposase
MCVYPFVDEEDDVEYAVKALTQYLIWLKSYDISDVNQEHINEIQALINNPPKNLEVYTL